MKKLFYLGAILLVVGAPILMSFGQNVEIPRLPLPERAPAFASWTIQFTYKEGQMKGEQGRNTPPMPVVDRTKSVTVTKTNNTYREEIVSTTGKKEEKWVFEGIELISVNGGQSIVPIAPPAEEEPSPDYSDYSRSDFGRLLWVSLSNYQGVKSYLGKSAYLFEATGPEGKMTAFLAIDSRLPLFFSEGGTTYTYTFNSPPPAELIPPASFQDVLKTMKAAMSALKRRPSPP